MFPISRVQEPTPRNTSDNQDQSNDSTTPTTEPTGGILGLNAVPSGWTNDDVSKAWGRVKPWWSSLPQGFRDEYINFVRATGAEPNLTYLGALMDKYKVSGSAFGGGGGGYGGGPSRAQRVNSVATLIWNKAQELGITLSLEAVVNTAKMSVAQNFNDEQVVEEVLRYADWATVQPGSLLANKQNVMALAAQYFVPMSDATAQDLSRRIASGEASESTITSLLRTQASQMYSWMKPYIDQGVAPKDLLSSSRDMIARSLEMDANAIDFTDKRFMSMVTVTDDKGVQRLANQGELLKNVRQDRAWASTSDARVQASNLALSLGKIFGRSAF
jgi:hypothetical protein